MSRPESHCDICGTSDTMITARGVSLCEWCHRHPYRERLRAILNGRAETIRRLMEEIEQLELEAAGLCRHDLADLVKRFPSPASWAQEPPEHFTGPLTGRGPGE